MKGNPPIYETYMCVQSENIVVGFFLFVFDFFYFTERSHQVKYFNRIIGDNFLSLQ